MRIASIIFTILGMVISLFSSTIWGLLSLVFGIWALVGLCNNEKTTACGVCCMIFASLLGGIFYLCWNPAEGENRQ